MKKKIVCIGNSIVNGFPLRRSQCFTSLLREATGWEIINKGNNGETTAQILARFERDVISHHPDIVVILTGTNDFIFQDATPEEAFQNLIHMANTAALRGSDRDRGKRRISAKAGLRRKSAAVHVLLPWMGQLL